MSWTEVGMKRYLMNFQAPPARADAAPALAPALP